MKDDLIQKVACQMIISDSFRQILLHGDRTERFGIILEFCANNSIEFDQSHREQIFFLLSIKAENQEEFGKKIEDELSSLNRPRKERTT